MSTKTISIGMVVMCGVSTILSFALGSYTCTGGSFNLGEFDTVQCLEWPENNSNTNTNTNTNTGGGGGGGETEYKGDFPSSPDLSKCDGMIYINDRVCRQDDGTFGLRWQWNQSALECRDLTSKYAIDVSSSADSNKKLRYITEPSGTKNGLYFNQVPTTFHSGQNITMSVTPLNVFNQKISNGAETELDEGGQFESCTELGVTPVSFNYLREVTEAAPAPVDCTGGTWSAPSACMADDGVTILTGEPGKCGAGITRSTRSGQTPAMYGGTCQMTSGTRCTVPCPSDEPADCVLAKYPSDHPTRAGQVHWNPAPGSADFDYMCCNVEPKGKVFQSADVFEDAQGSGNCYFTREVTCSCPS